MVVDGHVYVLTQRGSQSGIDFADQSKRVSGARALARRASSAAFCSDVAFLARSATCSTNAVRSVSVLGLREGLAVGGAVKP